MKTAARISAPTAMMVGLDDQNGGLCFAFFDDGGMRILATRDAAGACARISEVMPVIVVAAKEMPRADLAQLEDHAGAVGAQIVLLGRGEARPAVQAALTAAMARVGAR